MSAQRSIRATREMGVMKVLPGLRFSPPAFRDRVITAAKELARGDTKEQVRERHGAVVLEAALPQKPLRGRKLSYGRLAA